MVRLDDTLVLVPRFTPIEARLIVLASVHGPQPNQPGEESRTGLQLEGRLTGPLCEYAETLSQRIPLRADQPAKGSGSLRAHAMILEPCFWEPVHPFCYELLVELRAGEQLLDMRRILTGIRHLELDGPDLLLNGQPYFLEGARQRAPVSMSDLESWHEVECGAFVADASTGLCYRTDRWGPMVLHTLPPVVADMRVQVASLRNHPSLLMWLLPGGITGAYQQEAWQAIRKLDTSRPIGRILDPHEPVSAAGPADLVMLPIGHPAIGSPELTKPFIVCGGSPAAPQTPADFDDQISRLRNAQGSPPGLVGVIL